MAAAVIVIGGSDSSGGAGIARDIATLAELDCDARPVLTAVTAQTDRSVDAVDLVAPRLVARQLSSALETGPVGAVKIGMLGNEAIVAAIAAVLTEHMPASVVIDPVIASSSGTRLLSDDGTDALKRLLLPLCHVVTPNLPEAAMLTGRRKAVVPSDLKEQAAALRRCGARSVLIKGGHDAGEEAIDWLFDDREPRRFALPRIAGSMRGTGWHACQRNRRTSRQGPAGRHGVLAGKGSRQPQTERPQRLIRVQELACDSGQYGTSDPGVRLAPAPHTLFALRPAPDLLSVAWATR